MLKQSARVVAVEEDGMWVEARRRSACQDCSTRTSCGHALFDGLHTRVSLFKISSGAMPIPAPGAAVSLIVSGDLVIKLSLLFYLLPLAAMLGGSLLAAAWTGGEVPALAGAAAGLAAGLFAARLTGRRLEAQCGALPRIQEETARDSLTLETES